MLSTPRSATIALPGAPFGLVTASPTASHSLEFNRNVLVLISTSQQPKHEPVTAGRIPVYIHERPYSHCLSDSTTAPNFSPHITCSTRCCFTMTISNTVTAELKYFAPPSDGSKPWVNINGDTGTGERSRNFEQVPHHLEIENIRGNEDSVSLDTTGFTYYRRPQKYTSFSDDAEIEREYYPESIELVKQLTGASRVVPFDHSTSSAALTTPPSY